MDVILKKGEEESPKKIKLVASGQNRVQAIVEAISNFRSQSKEKVVGISNISIQEVTAHEAVSAVENHEEQE